MWSSAAWDVGRFDSCNAASNRKEMGERMRKSEVYEVEIFGKWIACGYSFRRISVGVTLSKYEFSVDLLVVWFSVEF